MPIPTLLTDVEADLEADAETDRLSPSDVDQTQHTD